MMKRKFNPDETSVRIFVFALLFFALLMAGVGIFLHCYGKADALHEDTRTILRGAPYTTEYDYSLESAAEVPVVETEIVTIETEALAEPVTEAATQSETEPETLVEILVETEAVTEAVPAIVWTDIDETYAVFIAKTLYGECRACTDTEIAAVAWCILNRVDSAERYFPDDVVSVITQPYQFLGYREENPIREDLLYMAKDVLMRWYAEKSGEEDVGRVLPKTYCFFTGDGKHNYFTEVWKGTDVWNWSMTSPY